MCPSSKCLLPQQPIIAALSVQNSLGKQHSQVVLDLPLLAGVAEVRRHATIHYDRVQSII
jgi:hypothetical protein